MRILLLNGPPGSGKDTLAVGLQGVVPGLRLEKFARPIRDAAIATFPRITEENLDRLKEVPVSGDVTLRKWMIAFSEDLMKPLFGQEIFGRLLATRLRKNPSAPIVVSDSGFVEEAKTLMRQLPASTEFLILRLHRSGYTFDGDSRDYLPRTLQTSQTPMFDLNNASGHPERMFKTASDILAGAGWLSYRESVLKESVTE